MHERPSILFVCRNLHRMAGGIERMATAMMNEMVRRGFRVGLITWDPENAEAHYALDSAVEWMKLDLGAADRRASWSLRWKRQLRIRRLARRFSPDVAIAFQAGTFISARTALLGLGIPIIAAERNSPDLFNYVRNGERKRQLSALALTTAPCITVQLESYRGMYPPRLRERIVAIPNPVMPVDHPPFPNETGSPPRIILNVGRLSFQKNQAFLIRAFARLAADHRDWTLALVGDGEHGDSLRALTRDLDLEERVLFAGAVKDVSAWYRRSAFLAFPSLWEGFPNALVEAFSHGLPAVGLTTTAGVNELIQHGRNGLLVPPDEAAYDEALREMITSDSRRATMGRDAAASVASYAPSAIFDQWEQLFLHLAEKVRPTTAG